MRPKGAAVSPRLDFATPGLSEPARTVYDWDLLEKVWQHSFETQLGLDMSQHPVISVDEAFSPRASQVAWTLKSFWQTGTTLYILCGGSLMKYTVRHEKNDFNVHTYRCWTPRLWPTRAWMQRHW